MDTNPYAPPKVRVADAEPDSHGLKRRSMLMMILFMFMTLGLYYLLWWYRRRPGLNRLNSDAKVSIWPLLLLTVLWVIQIGFGFVEGINPDAEVLGTDGKLLVSIFQILVGILMIVQTFRIKEMIEDHATPDPGAMPMFTEPVKLSGVMTFFFSIFYLQWAINRDIVGTYS